MGSLASRYPGYSGSPCGLALLGQTALCGRKKQQHCAVSLQPRALLVPRWSLLGLAVTAFCKGNPLLAALHLLKPLLRLTEESGPVSGEDEACFSLCEL